MLLLRAGEAQTRITAISRVSSKSREEAMYLSRMGLLISIMFSFIAYLDTFPGLSSCKLTIIKGQIMGAPIKRTPHKRMTALEKENWRIPANCILFNRLIEGPRDSHMNMNLQTCFSNRLIFIASNFRKLEDNENIIELSVREYST